MAVLKSGPWSDNHESSDDETGRRDGRITYRVSLDDPYPAHSDVLNNLDPVTGDGPFQVGDRWPGEPPNSIFLCRKVTPRQTQDIYIWLVECEFSTEPISQLEIQPEIEWGHTSVKRALQYDAVGSPLMNSAEDSFDPPYEQEQTVITLKVVNNLVTFDEADIDRYVNKANSAVFLGYSPYTALCKGITATNQKQGTMDYWRRTTEIHIRRDGWLLRILDQGYRRKPVSGIDEITDKLGALLSKPIFLDGEGFLLKDAVTTVSGNITAQQVQFIVSNGALIDRDNTPRVGAGNYDIQVEDEIMTVQDVTGNVVTVLRGQKGSVAAAHVDTTPVKLAPIFLRFEPFERANLNNLNLLVPANNIGP